MCIIQTLCKGLECFGVHMWYHAKTKDDCHLSAHDSLLRLCISSCYRSKAVAHAHQAPQLTLQSIKSGLVLQEAKTGKDAEADEAGNTAATERDNLKAQVASLTKKVSDVEAQLQKASQQKQAADKELVPNARSPLTVHGHCNLNYKQLLLRDGSDLSPGIMQVELDQECALPSATKHRRVGKATAALSISGLCGPHSELCSVSSSTGAAALTDCCLKS